MKRARISQLMKQIAIFVFALLCIMVGVLGIASLVIVVLQSLGIRGLFSSVFVVIWGASLIWFSLRCWQFIVSLANTNLRTTLEIFKIDKDQLDKWICAICLIFLINILAIWTPYTEDFAIPHRIIFALPFVSIFYLLWTTPFFFLRWMLRRLKLNKREVLPILASVCILLWLVLYVRQFKLPYLASKPPPSVEVLRLEKILQYFSKFVSYLGFTDEFWGGVYASITAAIIVAIALKLYRALRIKQ